MKTRSQTSRERTGSPLGLLRVIAPLSFLIPLAGYAYSFVDKDTIFSPPDTPWFMHLFKLGPSFFLIYLTWNHYSKHGNDYTRNILLAMVCLILGEAGMFSSYLMITGILAVPWCLYHAILISTAGFKPNKAILFILYAYYALLMLYTMPGMFQKNGLTWVATCVAYYLVMVTFLACSISRIKSTKEIWSNSSKLFLALGAGIMFIGDTYWVIADRHKDLPNNLVIAMGMVHLAAGMISLSTINSE